MRDITVLRQIAAHLDGWGGVRAQVVTEGVSWPSVQVQSGGAVQTWQCVHDRWAGQLVDADGAPLATIETTIGADASSSEVADGIKAVYRMLRAEPGRLRRQALQATPELARPQRAWTIPLAVTTAQAVLAQGSRASRPGCSEGLTGAGLADVEGGAASGQCCCSVTVTSSVPGRDDGGWLRRCQDTTPARVG